MSQRDLSRYVGIPYQDRGSDPAHGLDCWQLVRYFYEQELGIVVPRYLAFYDSSRIAAEASNAILRALPDWSPVGRASFGDVLVFRVACAPWHTAVALNDGLMLHTDQGHGSVIEPSASLRWRDRLYGAYAWKS